MKLALLLLSGIQAAFAFSTTLNSPQLLDKSQFYNVSGCSDAVYDGFDIVMCRFWDKAVISWPPTYLKSRNISKPYDAKCHHKTINRKLGALVCDYGDVKVIHWSHRLLQSQSEISINFLSAAMKQESTTPEEIADELMFETPLDQFITHREKRDPTDLVWESDGCTHAPDNPMGFPFLPACQRHDFGYRNYRAQNRLNKAAKKKINNQFKTE